jgi:hypothetical protein
MHLGMTGSRGKDQAEKIASIAARELKWNEEERVHYLAEFKKELMKDNQCLAG